MALTRQQRIVLRDAPRALRHEFHEASEHAAKRPIGYTMPELIAKPAFVTQTDGKRVRYERP